jgi:hypothetical protein
VVEEQRKPAMDAMVARCISASMMPLAASAQKRSAVPISVKLRHSRNSSGSNRCAGSHTTALVPVNAGTIYHKESALRGTN